MGYINDKDILEKELVPIEEEEFKGQLIEKEIVNWESYRMEILKKRTEPRKMNDILNILKKIWELLNKALIKLFKPI